MPAPLERWAVAQRQAVPVEAFVREWVTRPPSAVCLRYDQWLTPPDEGRGTLTVARAAIAYRSAAAAVIITHLTEALTGLGVSMDEKGVEWTVRQMLSNDRVRILAFPTLLLWIARLGQGEVKLYTGGEIQPRHVLNALHDCLPALRAHELEALNRLRQEARARELARQQSEAVSWEEYAASRGLDPASSPLTAAADPPLHLLND